MSFLVSEWADDFAPVADTYERIILIKLARRADDDGRGCFPSVKTMARTALCDEETVKRRIRSLVNRKLIALGDQSRAAHIPSNRRPKVYDVLVPFSWYSADQIEKVNRQAVENGRPPLTPQNRPRIAPAPTKGVRADKGVKNPKRSPKQPPLDAPAVHPDDEAPELPETLRDYTPELHEPGQGALVEPPVDKSGNEEVEGGGSTRAPKNPGSETPDGDDLGGSLSRVQGALQEPQICPTEPVHQKTGGDPLTPPTDDMPGKPGVPSTGEPEPDLTAGPTTEPVLEGDPHSAQARNEAQGPARTARARRAGGIGVATSTTVARFERHVEAMPDLAMPSTVKIAAQPEWRKAANRLFLARHAAGRMAADAVRVNPSLPLSEVEKLVATGGIEGQDPGEVVERAAKLVACQQELNRRRGGALSDEVHRAAVQASARWAAQTTPVPVGVDEDTWRAAVTELEVARADAGPDAAKAVARNLQADRPFVQSLITNRMGRVASRELIARTDRLVAAQLRVNVLAGVEATVSAPTGMAVTA